MKRRRAIIEYFLPIFAYIALIALLGIIFTILVEGLPLFKSYSIIDFLTGKVWRPTNQPPVFGSLPLIVSSIFVTIFSMIIAVPIGIATAIYLSKLSNPFIKDFLKPVVELLASIPSVVYGFFGLIFLAPLLQKIFHLSVGLNGFNASIILAFMALPTIASLAEDAISSVPVDIELASFGLGASKFETVFYTVIPAALPGIFTAVSLGFGRAIGETMAVLMVAGGAIGIPSSIFSPMRPLTATIAAEMAESPVGSQHYMALFSLAILLLLFVIVFNLIAEYFRKKFTFRRV
jgi:phosphate transport system permease protein